MLYKVLGVVGRLCVGAGVLVLLFVVYLLWGTNLSESGHQSSLRQEFNSELSQAPAQGSTTTSPPSSDTVSGSVVQSLAAGEAPPEGRPIAIIEIPKIDMDKVVVEGTGTTDLEQGPGHYSGTPLPGQQGNVAIAGHRTTYGAPFYNLNELGAGDQIYLLTLQGRFTYVVTGTEVVAPSDVAVIDPTTTAQLTLTTCHPRYSATQRLIIHARLTSMALPAHTSTAKPNPSGLGTGGSNRLGPFAWGLDCVIIGLVAYEVARRTGWKLRSYGAAVLPMLFFLYLFFQAVTPLLPQSY